MNSNKMTIKFGPSGLGGVKEAEKNLEEYKKLGFDACELAFTYGPYIKRQEDAERIGRKAKELGIQLSIHGPYWINLNSAEDEKIEKSKERILECLKVGTWLGATKVVIHPGFYGIKGTKVPLINPSFKFGVTPDVKRRAYENVKNALKEVVEKAKDEGYTSKVAVETTGKINVFGSIDETYNLVKDTGCDFCIDFAHILAREKDYYFREVFEKFGEFDEIHIQFSGIEYSEKGERWHKRLEESEIRKLLNALPEGKKITIISESPEPVEDSLLSLKIHKNS